MSRFSDLLGYVLDLFKILQRLGEVLYGVSKVLNSVLKFLCRGVAVRR